MPQWYEEWFDRAEYELVYKHRNDADAAELIDTIERIIAPNPGERILDVGCGRGRHAILMAQRGYIISGIDISTQSIEDARERAAVLELPLEFHVADMREEQCEQCFDIVVNLFTAFGYFETDDEHLHALNSMATALRPGGWFVQDFMNARYVQKTLVPHDDRHENGLTISQERWIKNGRINKKIVLSGPNENRQVFNESVRLLDLSDFERMYENVGLNIETCLGTYSGEPFADESPRLILFARKVSQ